ncbi:PHP domain-containing protein [Mangrovimicrobium sediminis]|uniref:PHP domain-containing protein n=1 Tax=Mangrovimicrobium sediminis TaxID=2562682 RepID=A0A4Z0M1Y7_9GAMM|nr:PHP domain-containing protein [Haliea sp. SAOS-164]
MPLFQGLPSLKIVRFDFHTHSTASDGALSPRELLARAAQAGVDLLAITDHDTLRGYREAAALDDFPGVTLVPGVEFSCRWSGANIHIVGLGMDCDHPAMLEGAARLDEARLQRARKIADTLEKRGFAGALEGALAEAAGSQLGRPHFARWLVARGHVADFTTAFDKYLGRGKPGDVKAFWPELAEVVGWISAAGGVAIIAHPLQYDFTRMKLNRLVAAFCASGGTAIEVLNGRQPADQVSRLCALAREYGLEVSAGSDFHRDGPYCAPLGVELRDFAGLAGVWRHWPVAATEDAQ